MKRGSLTCTIIKTPTRREATWHNFLNPARILLLGFAAVIGVGSLLLHLPMASASGESLPYIDSLFTATSAACVTGLVVVDTGTSFSRFGQLVILLLIQLGGLGIMTMSTLLALVIGRKINLRERLVMKEALNVVSLAGVVRLTKYIILVTLFIELAGAVLLSLRLVPQLGWGRGIYYSVFHSVSAFCNAGFDLFGVVHGPFSSLTAYVGDPLLNLVFAALIFLGGIGFTVIADIYNQRRLKKLSLHSKLALSMSALLIAAGMSLILLFESSRALAHLPWGGKVLASLFQAITPRTAGFNTIDLAGLQTATSASLIILMFIGASPGGTGGGIKTTTFATLLLGVRSIISGRREVTAFRRVIPIEQVLKSLAIITLAAFVVIAVIIALTFTEGADLLTLSFETVSAFGTVGLSLGITPHLSPVGKVLIAFTMFAGRLGPLTVALAIWAHQIRIGYRYPEERIMVG